MFTGVGQKALGTFQFKLTKLTLTVFYQGILAGLMLTFWMSRTFNDMYIEISLTILTAYLTFYVAEDLKTSGVLAVVFLGFVSSKYENVVSPVVIHYMHSLWVWSVLLLAYPITSVFLFSTSSPYPQLLYFFLSTVPLTRFLPSSAPLPFSSTQLFNLRNPSLFGSFHLHTSKSYPETGFEKNSSRLFQIWSQIFLSLFNQKLEEFSYSFHPRDEGGVVWNSLSHPLHELWGSSGKIFLRVQI